MSIKIPEYIVITEDISTELKKCIDVLNPDLIAILVDENTKAHCLSQLNYQANEVIEISSGEIHKNLNTCDHIWSKLTSASFSRKSLLINLGGGVIGDMGGFVGATYKRGMSFINIPTTLLSQVDASIGGKLAVDFKGYKNHIGLFTTPDKVIIDPVFLRTLPEREMRSGFAEVIKHALIQDKEHWNKLINSDFQTLNWNEIIPHSVAIKYGVTSKDPLEHGLRKILNFGHTMGHALESYFLTTDKPLLHGEAVALGMVLESFISNKQSGLSGKELESIIGYIQTLFKLPHEIPTIQEIEHFILQDKKNQGKELRFSLLESIGNCDIDIKVDRETVEESLKWYNQMKRLD